MADKHIEEVELARRLLQVLGYKDVTLGPSDRPDVVATVVECVTME